MEVVEVQSVLQRVPFYESMFLVVPIPPPSGREISYLNQCVFPKASDLFRTVKVVYDHTVNNFFFFGLINL